MSNFYDNLRKEFLEGLLKSGLDASIHESVEEAPVLDERTLVSIIIDRESVERGHLQTYLKNLDMIERKKSVSQGKVAIIFDGYNDDPREIFEIREVRNWVSRLIKIKPHLFYYLTPHFGNNIMTIFLCFAEIEFRTASVPDARSFSGSSLGISIVNRERTAKKVLDSAVAYSKKLKDPADKQFAMVNSILDCLDSGNVGGE